VLKQNNTARYLLPAVYYPETKQQAIDTYYSLKCTQIKLKTTTNQLVINKIWWCCSDGFYSSLL